MTALYSLSCKIGKVIGLPPVFYKAIPLPRLLETPLLPAWGWGLARTRSSRRAAAAARRRPESGKPSLSECTFVLEGPVLRGDATKFSINQTDIVITPGTWIIGELREGLCARVKGSKNFAGQVEAVSVVVLAGGV